MRQNYKGNKKRIEEAKKKKKAEKLNKRLGRKDENPVAPEAIPPISPETIV